MKCSPCCARGRAHSGTTLASVVSLFITAKVDLPIGAAIVCVLGIALILAALAAKILNRNSKPLLERSGVS